MIRGQCAVVTQEQRVKQQTVALRHRHTRYAEAKLNVCLDAQASKLMHVQGLCHAEQLLTSAI